MNVRWQLCRIAGVVALLVAASQLPATADPDFCVFNVITGVAFGNYDVLNPAQTTMNGTISYSCFKFPAAGETVFITLSRGNAPTYSPRYMLSGAVHLNYNLYLDAGLTKIWGNGTGGSSQFSKRTLNGVVVPVTIYGAIPAGQDVTPGAYNDTITVTINW